MTRGLLVAVAVVVAGLLVLPIAIVIPMSFTEARIMSFPPSGFTFRWFADALSDPTWQSRLITSVAVALGSASLATILGVTTAFGLVRGRFRGRTAGYGLVLLPLIVPVAVVAIGMYFVWVRGWSVGPLSLGGGLSGSIIGLVLAHAVLTMPIPVITVSIALVAVDRVLEQVGASLGAPPSIVFRRITFPLILPGVATGFVFAFLTSWDEVVVASFLSSPRVATVPVEMFASVKSAIDPTAAAISTMLLAVSAIALSLVLVIRGPRTTAVA